jgi:hypothetical protein
MPIVGLSASLYGSGDIANPASRDQTVSGK